MFMFLNPATDSKIIELRQLTRSRLKYEHMKSGKREKLKIWIPNNIME